MKIQHSVDIDATPEQVWAVTIDVEARPEHTPTMTTVEKLDPGPLQIGSEVRIKQPAQRSKIWAVTELEPNQRFAWATKSTTAMMTATHDIEQTSTGTTQTLSVDITGPLAAVIGAIARGPIRKALATENHAIKAVAEQP